MLRLKGGLVNSPTNASRISCPTKTAEEYLAQYQPINKALENLTGTPLDGPNKQRLTLKHRCFTYREDNECTFVRRAFVLRLPVSI